MAGIKDRLIQFILRGKDELSPAAQKSADALDSVRQEAEGLGKALDSAKDARGLVKSLENTQRAVEQSRQGLQDTERRVTELREALNNAPEAAGLQQSLKDAEREASRTRRALLALNGTLGDQEKAARAAGVDTNNLADEERRLASEVAGAKTALAENGQQLKALQREQAAAARGAAEHTSRLEAGRDAMARGAKQVLSFAAAYVSLNAVFGLVQRGLNLVGTGIRSVITDGSDKEQALAQLEAALVSTGNAAGFTGEQLLEMADDFEKSSMLTAEQVQAAQTRLLSYTDIVGEQFPAAMQIVIDQQQRLGISAEQSAEIVGRALQSPVEAMTTLGRQGFKLEDGQKRLLKQLVATGRTAEAQAVIMDMMTEAYGGSAAAARMDTAAGLWKGLTDRFGDFASRVSNSGAFDFVKQKLAEVAESIEQMDKDGRLDALATSLSNAFIQGAQKVEEFATRLLDVDFKKLTDDSAAWLNQFGEKIDSTIRSVELLTTPLRVAANVVTGFASGAAAAFTGIVRGSLAVIQTVARAIPDALGGESIRAGLKSTADAVTEFQSMLIEQAKQDGTDLKDIWNNSTAGVKQAAVEQTAVVKAELDSRRVLDQAYADELVANQGRIKAAALDAAISGTQAIAGIADALKLIDTADTSAQFEGLRGALLRAFRDGKISQDEYQQSTGLLQGKLRSLGSTTAATSDELDDLKSIMSGIARAANEVDFNRLRAAMRKAYSDGKISAEEFAQAQAELNEKVAQLKPAAESSTRAVRQQAEALTESTEAAGSSIRRLSSDTEEASGGMNWFAEVLTRARTPLAELSEAALAAFDAMQGINSVNRDIDTSSIDKTAESLQQAKEQALAFQGALDLEGSRASGLGQWMMQTFIRSEQVKVSYLEQKYALQSLMASYESGSITTERFSRSAASARRNLNLLDESDLSSLEGAIDAAKQKMQALSDSTRSTLDGLQMELLQLKGTEEEIEKARFSSRRQQLELQQVDARQTGDKTAIANIQQALRTLDEIERASATKRDREAQQKQVEQAAKTVPAPVQPQAPAKIIRLETRQGTVQLGLQNDEDETKLLGILESAGLRSR